MVKIIFCGCFGRMGNAVRQIVKENADMEIVAGIDICEGAAEFPVYKGISDVKENADVIIDFSSPKALDSILDYAISKNIPVVLCTTGYSEEQLAQINAASEKIAILRSANMSLGINTVAKLIQTAAQILAGNGYDIEIVERHHNQKKDAPSGTALLLADAINKVCDNRYEYVYDRSARREARPKDEIGISSLGLASLLAERS